MAGARFVEEVLERGGGEQFRITVFGDEPHGNYNRIMLSPVLAGEEHEDEIVLNSREWYADNGVTLRAGVRADKIDTAAKLVHAADGTVTTYDHLVLATGSYSFVPPMKGVKTADGELLPGVHGFRTIDETRAMLDAVGRCTRAVVMGGGLLGLEAARALQGHGLHVELVHAMPHLMNMQLDAEAGAILKKSVESLGIAVHLDVFATDVFGTAHVEGVGLADGRRIDADLLVIAAGVRPNTDIGVRVGARGGARHRRRRPDAHRRPGHLRDRRVRAAPRRGLRPGGAGLGAREGAGRRRHRHRPDRRLSRQPDGDQAQGGGGRRRRHGRQHPRTDDDEFLVISEPKRGVHLSLVIRDGQLVGAILLGDTRKVAYLTQAFDRGAPLPEERIRLLVDLGDGAQEVTSPRCPPTTQVCNCNGVTKGAICGAVADGCGRSGRSWTPPGPARAAGRASRWSSRSWSGRPTATSRRTPPPHTTCPAFRCRSPS